MSLLFCDSFDHYTTVLQKWTTDAGTHTIGAFGTNGTNSVRSSSTGTLAKTLPGGSKATLVAGCNFRTVTFPNTAKQVIGFRDSGTDQCDVRVKLDGTLQVTRNGTVLGTGTTVLAANVFYFIELKVTFATGATGSATLRINNNVELTLTNVQTAASANATANQLVLDTTGSNSIADWDDLYCCDSLTANNNDFLGVLRVQVMLPDGAGNYAQWTPNAGTNFSRVNETPPDEDTTYNASSTLNQIDTFTFGNVTPATGTVKGVQVGFRVKTDDGGARTVAPVVRQAATDNVGTGVTFNSTTYSYAFQTYDLNPQTAVAWTITDVNTNAEFGYKLTA